MKNKLIISAVIFSFLLSASLLSWNEKKQSDENVGKNWWSLYFVEPKSDVFDFVIENHSDKNNFEWTILSDKEKIKEGAFEIKKGEKGRINFSLSSDKKITIQVISGNEKKEIYKNF
ncbi:MAG TPA: hypothetical protein P5232_00495 [Candidatus Moranbacteria bacterium]|nr:hypothetical protein [Candidatus Moranbacteria bacterium]